jgi:hypothetical protein
MQCPFSDPFLALLFFVCKLKCFARVLYTVCTKCSFSHEFLGKNIPSVKLLQAKFLCYYISSSVKLFPFLSATFKFILFYIETFSIKLGLHLVSFYFDRLYFGSIHACLCRMVGSSVFV